MTESANELNVVVLLALPDFSGVVHCLSLGDDSAGREQVCPDALAGFFGSHTAAKVVQSGLGSAIVAEATKHSGAYLSVPRMQLKKPYAH